MAGPRPLMVFRDRRDRIAMPQHPPASAAAGFQSLHPHLPRAQQQRFQVGDEDELGLLAAGWEAGQHQQHQQALAAVALRREQHRVNSRPSLPHHLTTTLLHHGPGPGQPPEWDGGGLARHVSAATSGRLGRNPLVNESVVRMRQQPVDLSREHPRGISREILTDWRLREGREEIRKSDIFESAGRGWGTSHTNPSHGESRDRMHMSRGYQRSLTVQQLESTSRTRGLTYTWEEKGHADLIARYGSRSSSRNLERTHPTFEAVNQPRKRSRGEDADCDRERLLRHRRLSGIDNPPPSSTNHSLVVLDRDNGSDAPKADGRPLQAEEDEREEGQVTPPPPVISSHKVQHGVECKTMLFKQEQDCMVSSRAEGIANGKDNSPHYRTVFSFPSLHQCHPYARAKSSSPRPLSSRDEGRLLVENFQPVGASKQSLLKHDRLPSPRLKDNDRMLTRRVVEGAELFPVLTSTSPDRRKRVIKESEIQSRSVNYKSVEKSDDDIQYKRHQQNTNTPQRDIRSQRKNRLRGEELDRMLLERLAKESSDRMDNDVKRKPANLVPSEDSRQMTISVQKYGQRVVKVEEYRSGDPNSRASSQNPKEQRLSHRGGGSTRDASGTPLSVVAERGRTSVVKRKDSEGGRRGLAAKDKPSRPQSSKAGGAHFQQLRRSGSQERISPSSQHVKNEAIIPTDKHGVEPERHQSIFSRLSGFKSQAVVPLEPTSKNQKTALAILRQESNSSLGNDITPLVSSSKQISPFNGVHKEVHFQGFPLLARDIKVLDTGVLVKACSRQTGARERLNKDVLKVQDDDQPRGEEIANQKQKLESAGGRFPHRTREVSLPVENGVEILHKDSQLSGSAVSGRSELLKLPLDGRTVPNAELEGPSHVNSSDRSSAGVYDHLSGTGCKSVAKVIPTGHKKDQVLKKSASSPVEPVLATSSLVPISSTDLVTMKNPTQEKSDDKILTVTPEVMTAISGVMIENLSTNFMGKRTEQDHAARQMSLVDTRRKNFDRPTETFQKETVSVGSGSISSLSTPVQPSKPSLEAGEFGQIITSQVIQTSSDLPSYKDADSTSGNSQAHMDDEAKKIRLDGEAKSGLSTAVISYPSLSLKEVRLFGANLNAPVSERIESKPEALQIVDHEVVTSSGLPGNGNASPSVCLDSTAVIQELDKDSCLPVVLTGDEEKVVRKEPVKSQEEPLSNDHVVKVPTSLHADVLVAKEQIEEQPAVVKEQYVPPPNLQKAIPTAQGRQVITSHSTGPHTWRRGTACTVPVISSSIFRGENMSGMTQPGGRARGIQRAAYVRKGNSLVRAPGAVSTMHPANQGKEIISIMSQQVGPIVQQRPMVIPGPFRKTFVANSTSSRSFFPSHRKYLAQPLDPEGLAAPSARPAIPSKMLSGISETDVLLPPSSAIPKSPPQGLKVSLPVTAVVPLIGYLEEHTGQRSILELPSTGGCVDNVVPAGASRTDMDNSNVPSSTLQTSASGYPCSKTIQKPAVENRLYVRRKANQLVVAPSSTLDSLCSQAGKIGLTPDLYVKRKLNQLVRSNADRGTFFQDFEQGLSGNGPSPDLTEEQGCGITSVPRKMRLGKALRQKKGRTGRSSWVWTLNGTALGYASPVSAQSLRAGPLLFPWKRQQSFKSPVRPQRVRSFPEGKKGSLLFLMSKRLRKVRPVQPVYTRSADGFSLHRSGVMSLGGGNLKWTKSLEKRAKQASEAATKAVAEAERRRREKKEAVVEAVAKAKAERRAARKAARGEGERVVWVGLVRYKMDAASKTLQRIPDTQATRDADVMAPTGLVKTPSLLTPRRSIIGGTVYLRVGNGNQLVRDPKAASRALASEKVRWSLHIARSRRAKKQQYCQFFTRFGKCNKENGKCPYIHDPDKVAVCTKFLKGNCTDDHCLLTHKVIPERMPDCSFFLEGLCSNEVCPYRHVNVNPKAPYCDGFLRGYCKDGDKCDKKHRYICPAYAETGECLDRARCKFHHPKKKDKPAIPLNGRRIGTKRKRRYFSSTEPDSIRQKVKAAGFGDVPITVEEDGSLEFISLGNIESGEDQEVIVKSVPWSTIVPKFSLEEAELGVDVEKWIKPAFLLGMTSPTAAAC